MPKCVQKQYETARTVHIQSGSHGHSRWTVTFSLWHLASNLKRMPSWVRSMTMSCCKGSCLESHSYVTTPTSRYIIQMLEQRTCSLYSIRTPLIAWFCVLRVCTAWHTVIPTAERQWWGSALERLSWSSQQLDTDVSGDANSPRITSHCSLPSERSGTTKRSNMELRQRDGNYQTF